MRFDLPTVFLVFITGALIGLISGVTFAELTAQEKLNTAYVKGVMTAIANPKKCREWEVKQNKTVCLS